MLEWALFLINHEEITFAFSWGDKELFPAGFALTGRPGQFKISQPVSLAVYAPQKQDPTASVRACRCAHSGTVPPEVPLQPRLSAALHAEPYSCVDSAWHVTGWRVPRRTSCAGWGTSSMRRMVQRSSTIEASPGARRTYGHALHLRSPGSLHVWVIQASCPCLARYDVHTAPQSIDFVMWQPSCNFSSTYDTGPYLGGFGVITDTGCNLDFYDAAADMERCGMPLLATEEQVALPVSAELTQ